MTNIRVLFYPTLGIVFGFLASASLGYPLGFLILTVLVRTAPRVVEPRLVPRRLGSLTTLGLGDSKECTFGEEIPASPGSGTGETHRHSAQMPGKRP